MNVTKDAESVVRDYLLYLQDPSRLIDVDAVGRLREQLGAESDPIAKLRILSQLRRAQEADEHALREGFTLHAKVWAEENHISAESFLELGVDAKTLRTAGFAVAAANQSGRRRGSGQQRAHAAPVSAIAVMETIRQQRAIFTLADLASATGASPMTVRKAVNELIEAGEIARLGPTPNWSQSGRAPIQFRRAVAQSAAGARSKI